MARMSDSSSADLHQRLMSSALAESDIIHGTLKA